MGFNPDRVNIAPDENDSLLSIINGFEDNHWLMKTFKQFVFDNITLTALNAEGSLSVGNIKPAHITTITIILWMDILCFEFAERHLVFTEER